jgi:DNA repair/transcription protein MET18/MMS19
MEGEKDPRCLILCLRVLRRLQKALPEAADEHAETVFDVTACYFPITFTPPPNDPYGITPEMLAAALQDVLTGRYDA